MKFYDVKKMYNWEVEKEVAARQFQLQCFFLTKNDRIEILNRLFILYDEMIRRNL